MKIDVQVKHLDATLRGLQDIHQDLVSKAATCNGSFSNITSMTQFLPTHPCPGPE